METKTESNGDDMASIKDMRQQLENRIDSQRLTQQELLSSLQVLVPDIVSSLNLSLRVVSSFNDRPFTPLPTPPPNPNPNPRKRPSLSLPPRPIAPPEQWKPTNVKQNQASKESQEPPIRRYNSEKFTVNESGSSLSVIRSMVAVCLLERVPFTRIESSEVLNKLENDQSAMPAEKSALHELGGESGAILAVEMALRSMKEDNAGVELEDYVEGSKSRVAVVKINRSKLIKELPESSHYHPTLDSNGSDVYQNQNQNQLAASSGGDLSGGVFGIRPTQDTWLVPPLFPAGVGPRGGPRGVMGMVPMPRGMGVGVPSLHRPPLGPPNVPMSGSNVIPLKPRTEEDDIKELEALLNKKSFREMQKSKTGEELLDLIHRPTARETAVAAKFKTKGGSQLKEYCSALTKEDCRRQSGSFIACEKVHFRRIIAPHTDINLGDCSFLDTCRHMKTCKYVHYELDPTPDVPPVMMGTVALPPPKPTKPQRAEYCSEVELGEPQWINCDIRNFRMDILGQFGVIMADPPWDIHMELPYGTMADDEMRNLNVPALQTDGLIFLWVTGRAMELGRECLELWGYKRVEEIIWVKTNQLQRIIRTGRTGHWLNHSKEHCLVGIKGNPEVNRNIDTDVIVAEVRETSRKPDEMYPMLERISPRTRKLELFARMHNTHAGWMSLGNQLNGVRLVDEGLRARFKAAYPDVEVQPASPPRASTMEVDSNIAQMRSPFAGADSKPSATQLAVPTGAETAFGSEEKPMVLDIEMAG
ncbi:MT-A70-like [Dillenia turbinata]|uniref:MT-A70-like n=1 Tax=Dillenia turbinata TaxID=194707 RepID=A0AAN8VK15_9MAGN